MTNIIIFSSLFGTLFSGLLGKYIGVNYTKILVFITILVSLITTYILYFSIIINNEEYILNLYT